MKFKQCLAVLLLLATFGSLAYLNAPTSLEQIKRITVAYEQGQISLKTFRKIQRFLLDQQLR
ncbi:MAG: hypothetical protein P8N63_08390 [Pseudomonadales bacterium]|nr:hypothetical protein [Pseudomonadales bacterium]